MRKLVIILAAAGLLIYARNYIRTGRLQAEIDANSDYSWAEIAQTALIKYHYYKGDLDRALWEIDHFAGLFQESPRLADMFDKKANIFYQKDNGKSAAPVFRHLLASYPDDPRRKDWQKKLDLCQ